MSGRDDLQPVLDHYPDDCRPTAVESLDTAGGFSGARLWRLATPRGPMCLRRWPAEHPTPERLQFIQAVLWHVRQEGFDRAPLPVETRTHAGFVRHAGHLWEIVPWLPGKADYKASPSPAKLKAAMTALAEFHVAARSFPLPEPGPAPAPGILERIKHIERLIGGDIDRIAAAMTPGDWPELYALAPSLISHFRSALRSGLLAALEFASQLPVRVQPCIRDIWHDHVLFEGQELTGLIDFGAMRPDNVACDVARLLGSLAEYGSTDWQTGLRAYADVRPLSHVEVPLVDIFYASGLLLSGINWLEWIYVDGRVFPDRDAVVERVSEIEKRLSKLVSQ